MRHKNAFTDKILLKIIIPLDQRQGHGTRHRRLQYDQKTHESRDFKSEHKTQCQKRKQNHFCKNHHGRRANLNSPQIDAGQATPEGQHSQRTTALTQANGSNVVVDNSLTLETTRLPLNAFAFYLTSRTQGFVQNPGGSAGNLCLSGAIGRYVGPGQIQNSGMTGGFQYMIDLNVHPTPTGIVQVQAGQTWNFQCWHRDSVGGAAVSNFSDAISIGFQ